MSGQLAEEKEVEREGREGGREKRRTNLK